MGCLTDDREIQIQKTIIAAVEVFDIVGIYSMGELVLGSPIGIQLTLIASHYCEVTR